MHCGTPWICSLLCRTVSDGGSCRIISAARANWTQGFCSSHPEGETGKKKKGATELHSIAVKLWLSLFFRGFCSIGWVAGIDFHFTPSFPGSSLMWCVIAFAHKLEVYGGRRAVTAPSAYQQAPFLICLMETGLPLKEALIHHSFLCWTCPPLQPFHPGADGKQPLLIQLGKYEMQKYQRGCRSKENIKWILTPFITCFKEIKVTIKWAVQQMARSAFEK